MKKKIVYCLFASVLSSVIYADVVPSSVDYVVRPLYGYRADGTPGRIVTVKLKGKELKGELSVDVIAKGKTEMYHFPPFAQKNRKEPFCIECERFDGGRNSVTFHSTYREEVGSHLGSSWGG